MRTGASSFSRPITAKARLAKSIMTVEQGAVDILVNARFGDTRTGQTDKSGTRASF
jgi:hypothetical protein